MHSAPPRSQPDRVPLSRQALPAGWVAIISTCALLAVSRGAEIQERVRFTNTVPAAGGKNLVPNGSFEAGAAGWSSLGRGAGDKNAWAPLVENWGNLESLHGTVEKTGAAHGNSFLRIRLGGENTPVFNFDYFYPVDHRELRPLAANLGWIEVVPGETYTISLNMRASRSGVQGAFGVRNEDAGQDWRGSGEEILRNVALTEEWRRYSHTFVPKHPYLFVLAGPDLAVEEDVAVDVDAIQLEKGAQATDFSPRADLEIGVAPTAPAGVFTKGEPAALEIAAFNDADKPARARIKFRVTDFADEAVGFPDVVLEVPAGARVERQVPLPADWQGFYRVVAGWKSGQTEESRLLRVAIVPPRTTLETVIGTNHAYPTKNLLGLAKKAGVTWYRDWSLKWQHIEPEKGKYRWEISDPQIHRVTAQGLKLLAMIPFPSAEWNSTAPDLATIRAASPRHGGGGQGDDKELLLRARWAWMPRDVGELNGFLSAAVGRYRDHVQVWEFLNEALYTTYALPGEKVLKTTALKSYTVPDYLDLLRKTVPAIRAANPGARIMGGGMYPGDASAQAMIKDGLLDYIDILGVHDYPGAELRRTGKARPPEAVRATLDSLQETMRAGGGPKPLWITEFSYYGTDDLPRRPFVPIAGLNSEPQLLGEKQTADYIIRYCTIFLGRGGEKIFLHSGGTGSVNKPGTESCLFADGAVRKVFPALAVYTEMLGPGPRFVADKMKGSGMVFAFETSRQSLLILWDPEEKTTVRLPAGVTGRDLMGRVLTGPDIRLGASPVYFVGPSGQSDKLLTTCVGSMSGGESTTR